MVIGSVQMKETYSSVKLLIFNPMLRHHLIKSFLAVLPSSDSLIWYVKIRLQINPKVKVRFKLTISIISKNYIMITKREIDHGTFRSNTNQFYPTLEKKKGNLAIVDVMNSKISSRIWLLVDILPFELWNKMPNHYSSL